MLREIARGFLDLIYPPHCLLCSNFIHSTDTTEGICPACQSLIERNKPPFCILCSRYLGPHPRRNLCNLCQGQKPAYHFAWAACLYDDRMKHLLHYFKYHNKLYLRHFFNKVMISFIAQYQLDIMQFDYLVPVPLHPVRRRERGYNQSELLAEGLATYFQRPLLKNNLVRVRPTVTQTHFTKKERWTNIKEAFKIKSPQQIKDKSVLLIDDLLTTGATASEAAHTLIQSGCPLVGVYTLAIKT